MIGIRFVLVRSLAICALSSGIVIAGGSVSFDESAIPLLRTEPTLLQFVQQALEVAPVGNAVRLGKQFGEEVGKRITPFTFEARPKGAEGPFTLLLIINSPEGMNNDNAKTVTIEIRPLQRTDARK